RHVNFIGHQSKEKVLSELSSSYVTIVPSVIEAFGFVIIESFSVKTPVIGSDSSGIAEVIGDNIDGLLFEPQNHLDLAAKIRILLMDEEMRKRFSENGYNRFKDNFEIKNAIK